ncbi:MAG: leucine--tRNA ligase [Conexivisphaera sp.]
MEAKWQRVWEERGAFWAEPDSRPKFMATFPFPYVNAPPHIGSIFTLLRVEFMSRYMRMKGYNVLFAQGWHATGGPIVSAALRVREGDPKQIANLRSMGVPEDEIKNFENPEHWVRYFSARWREDLRSLGLSIDWRREFYTTSMNPSYSAFVRWQYIKLREKGLVAKGAHPVVWCPKEKKVVGDHDRPDEYVGIGPEEAVVIKFRGDDGLVYPCLTYRPETLPGATNVWVRPDAEYELALVDGERWVASHYSLEELSDQGHSVEVIGRVRGSELVGRMAVNPASGERVPVLPASFVDPELGSGIVMSVPAHAPYDYAALRDLKRDPSRYGVDPSLVEGLAPRGVIKVEGHGDAPAAELVERLGIIDQGDRRLEHATRDLYSLEYYEGRLGDAFGDLAGLPVREGKAAFTERLVRAGFALRINTLPQRVYCRCGARTHVKLVSDQWFLRYSDPEWKSLAHECIDSMRFYPEDVRRIFHGQVDWIQDWACAHKGELGTPLPWDESWVVESLSDSTIYMAYYTIAKYLQHPDKYGIDTARLSPELFDYVFLGRGDPSAVSSSTGINEELLRAMRSEFLYWYPVDFRNSGKDLMYNHLIFFIFHHVAVFPREHWPRGIGINGWVTVEGKKMSKTAGNFILARDAVAKWGADATRVAEALAGDPGLEDPSFDSKAAADAVEELYSWYEFAVNNYGKGRDSRLKVDDWFESVLNRTLMEVDGLMSETKFRSALVAGFYELQNKFRWYLRRSGGVPNRELQARFIEAQTLILAPFAPHVAEEIWSSIGKEGLISLSRWPEADASKVRPELEAAEDIVRRTLEDVRHVLSLVRGTPSRVRIIVADEWKYRFVDSVRSAISSGYKLGDAINSSVRALSPELRGRAAQVASAISRDPSILSRFVGRDLERRALEEALDFLSSELKVPVILEDEPPSGGGKASQAVPARPAVIVELERPG